MCFPLQKCSNNLAVGSEDDKDDLLQKEEITKDEVSPKGEMEKMFHFVYLFRQIKPLQNIWFQKISYPCPGWSPRANQRWTALFHRFQKFQRWSALFQNGLRKPALISAVSELFSAGFLWISAVQRWIKMNWETNENASCKFEKVLGSRKTCSFGVYQLWKKSIRRNSSQKFELTHPPLPHASWSHVPCRIVKRLKYRVLSKKRTENKAKVVLISVFLLFQTKMWRILTSAEQRWIRRKQPWTALKQLCFRENQRWNSSDSALIILLWKFGVSALFQRKSALFQRKSALKQLWFSADFFALKISSFRAVSEKISAVQLWISSVSELNSAVSALIFSSENFRFQRCSELNQRCSEIFR